MAAMKFGFGKALTRKEDDTLLRGAGRYVADVSPDATLHAVVLRSPHAHANFAITDLARVRAMKGVRLVLTAAEITELGPLPTPGVLPGVDIKVPDYPILATDTVRHVGDAIAFVVADTLNGAKDAAEAITVDWRPLPHVIGAVAALKSGAPPVWKDQPGNLAFETSVGDPFHRLAGPLRRHRGQCIFAIGKQLGAEAAADIRADHPHLLERHLQHHPADDFA